MSTVADAERDEERGEMGGGTEDGGTAVPEEERLARVALSKIAEPGDELVGRWLETYGAQEVLRALCGESALPGASRTRWEGLRLRARDVHPGEELRSVTAQGGRFLCPGDGEWPCQLDDLGAARPVGLWVRGPANLRICALRSVAVVGARACSEYGGYVAAALGSDLAGRGWTVVSGAAYGVDGAAHRGALAADGATVGVLACGIDRVYPASHAELIRRIGEQGLLVAELPPGDHPTKSRFILRNRVIAALTRGTVVVEAALRSGSLATARHARRLDRWVMAVPGPVTSSLSAGAHELVRTDGGSLVTDAGDVVELVGGMGELGPHRRGPSVPHDALPPLAARVLDALPARGSAEVAQLALRAGLSPEAVRAPLQELHALGFVIRQGKQWQLAPSAKPAGSHPIE